jgi:hypothetical protein
LCADGRSTTHFGLAFSQNHKVTSACARKKLGFK